MRSVSFNWNNSIYNEIFIVVHRYKITGKKLHVAYTYKILHEQHSSLSSKSHLQVYNVKKQQESERGNVQVVCFRQEPEEDVFCALLFGFNLRPHTRYWADGADWCWRLPPSRSEVIQQTLQSLCAAARWALVCCCCCWLASGPNPPSSPHPDFQTCWGRLQGRRTSVLLLTWSAQPSVSLKDLQGGSVTFN